MTEAALCFASKAHFGQFRKGTNIPYIHHPMEAARIVATICRDERLIAAAYLHDTVEDCAGVTPDMIEEEFGLEVAELVSGESEDKSRSWKERKAATIYRLQMAREEMKIVALGDKLSNMRAIARDYRETGDDVWNKFRVRDKEQIGWYYTGLEESLSSLGYTQAYEEYSRLVEEVFIK